MMPQCTTLEHLGYEEPTMLFPGRGHTSQKWTNMQYTWGPEELLQQKSLSVQLCIQGKDWEREEKESRSEKVVSS